jgi:hypothetical protein
MSSASIEARTQPDYSRKQVDNSKHVDYWRAFKGGKVRVWFSRDVARFCYTRTNAPGLGEIMEKGASPMAEGILVEVVESPFGLMLKDVALWETDKLQRQFQAQATDAPKPEVDIKQMFVPMTAVSRIDFL